MHFLLSTSTIARSPPGLPLIFLRTYRPPPKLNPAPYYFRHRKWVVELQEGQPTSFRGIGVPYDVVGALRKAFPTIQQPTLAQTSFFKAAGQGGHVFFQSRTGTGKSLALVLTLLSKHYIAQPGDSMRGGSTSLLIVPHRDLAYQLKYWTEQIWKHLPSPKPKALELVQVLARNADIPLEQQISNLHSYRPKILIATPQALQDVLEQDEQALHLDQLDTVVVDEVDYLIETLPTKGDHYKQMKAMRVMRRHPSPTRLILERIYGTDDQRYCPQLILATATLRATINNLVIVRSDWFRKARITDRFTAVTSRQQEGDKFPSEHPEQPVYYSPHRPLVQHHALVVDESGKVSNIEMAVQSPAPEDQAHRDALTESKDSEISSTTSVATADEQAQQLLDVPEVIEFETTPSPFNPDALEAIAAAFALDVPRVALLVLHPMAAFQRCIYELRKMGVNARGIDLLEETGGGAYLLRSEGSGAANNPTLLVTTLAAVRGIDLPNLTHVFILGVPDEPRVESYVHTAGRVGRAGQRGKVITVLEGGRKTKLPTGQAGSQDEPKVMSKLFKSLQIRPTKFEHFI